jgi:hypothetical protein
MNSFPCELARRTGTIALAELCTSLREVLERINVALGGFLDEVPVKGSGGDSSRAEATVRGPGFDD